MPNGERGYNKTWCDERHDKITDTFDVVFKRLDRVDLRTWTILILLIMNLGGVIGILLKG